MHINYFLFLYIVTYLCLSNTVYNNTLKLILSLGSFFFKISEVGESKLHSQMSASLLEQHSGAK